MSLSKNTVNNCEVSVVSDSVTDVTDVTVVSSVTIDDQAFNRTNIQKNTAIKLVDTLDGLDMFCYIKEDIKNSKLVSSTRGVVFDGETCVFKGFGQTINYSQSDLEIVENEILPRFDECKFYDSLEGSLIRMFNYNGKWYTTTHRKLDAFRCKWSSNETFGNMFVKSIESIAGIQEKLSQYSGTTLFERFKNSLNIDYQYSFLIVSNNDNRLVSIPIEGQYIVYHTGTFVNGLLDMSINCVIPTPVEHNFKNVDDIYYYVNIHVDWRDAQGVIIFAPDNVQYKIYNKQYYEYLCVRGNEPSIKFRYLQIRNNRSWVNSLRYLYPDMCVAFDEYENMIYDICKYIYKCYIDRFIKKMHVVTPTEEYAVIRACHSWHNEDRSWNKLSLNKVCELFDNQTPSSINRMIRHLKLEKSKVEPIVSLLGSKNTGKTVYRKDTVKVDEKVDVDDNEIGVGVGVNVNVNVDDNDVQ